MTPRIDVPRSGQIPSGPFRRGPRSGKSHPPGPLPKEEALRLAAMNVEAVIAEQCRRDLFAFIQEFWDCVSPDEPQWNWHIPYLCQQLMLLAIRVSEGKPKIHDMIINIPPGTTKSVTCSVMFPAWCWTRWPWMRFIVSTYSSVLSLEHAEYSRDLIKSDKFRALFPYLGIKQDKDTKSNFRIVEHRADGPDLVGGNRYSTSVGGTLTGFHGHILIVDDPVDPNRAVSDLELASANRWMEQTLSTRKIDKAVTPTVLIMQRLHQDDPTGHTLAKGKENIFHVCLPGEIRNYRDKVRPVELILNYQNELLDPKRLGWLVLEDLEVDLGQYGYAGQIGQNPVPPGGGMFQVDHFGIVDQLPPPGDIANIVRYWDKAGTPSSKTNVKNPHTCGVKMMRLKNNRIIVADAKRGQWSTDERERIIRETAEADGVKVVVYHEQEPGSGGKESAEATVRNLLGFVNHPDRPTGDKIHRADPYSVQVNNGNVMLLRGMWNFDFIEEHRYFPFGTNKDQVDAASGACAKLAAKRVVRSLLN